MIDNIGLVTYGIAALGYLALCALLLAHWRVRPLGPGLMLATACTALGAGTIALGTLYDYPPITLIQLGELLRNLVWLAFLLQLMGFQEDGNVTRWQGRDWRWPLAGLGMVALALILLEAAGGPAARLLSADGDLTLALWLVFAVCGLLAVEQVYRNANSNERWGVKFLCLGLGAVFAYDLFMYAQALLFWQLNTQLWQARGLIWALVLPWLAVAIARSESWRLDVHLSRQAVFHSVTLMGAGLYLLCMALIGYFIKYLGGDWGGVLQIGFLAASGALLLSLLFSGALRARIRVLVAKHFFSYRYDYRVEWLKFTEGLSAPGKDVPGRIIGAMASIVLSPGGVILYRDASNHLTNSSGWDLDMDLRAHLGNLVDWVRRRGWVIDLRELREKPDLYGDLALPDALRHHESLWLIIPLVFEGSVEGDVEESLEGLVFLGATDLKRSVNWEDRDLLKTAGRQAAALLAQQRASAALVEARQFDAFNRLSAYVVHDLKNILAQQSLMVSNAQKHRDNPAFIDDMITTVENSVERMQRLMEQMRSELRSAGVQTLDLDALLQRVVSTCSARAPVPTLETPVAATVDADPERLATVFSHLIQNAQEATPDEGRVTLAMTIKGERVEVSIRDTGSGMSPAFIRERLFKPFESTKGLTGMGIGAFESREYLRQLGGDIGVRSQPGEGSEFTVSLPLSAQSAADPEPATDSADCDLDTPQAAEPVAH